MCGSIHTFVRSKNHRNIDNISFNKNIFCLAIIIILAASLDIKERCGPGLWECYYAYNTGEILVAKFVSAEVYAA